MKKIKRAAVIGVSAVLSASAVVGMAACGGKSDEPGKQGKIEVSFWCAVDSTNYNTIKGIVDTYNETNTDNVKIKFTRQAAGYSSNLTATLQGANPPDIVQIDEKVFKGFAVQNFLAPLDDYITAEEKDGSKDFNLNDIYPGLVNRYRIDPATGAGGGDNPLLGIPYTSTPTMIYYNKTLFAAENVNVVSYAESELPAGLLPHGYYVYSTAPVAGMKARADGKYHVFNDCIPMNWEELRELSKLFTKEYYPSVSSTYGFMNEWWFSYGWSVGGDCLEWDTYNGKEQYTFALGNDNPGYLVTGEAGVTLDGVTYEEGSVLPYEAKKYVAEHKTDADVAKYIADKNLYPLPSTREAFTEFCRLSQTTSKAVNAAGDKGYGISPSPTTLSSKGKDLYFTSGEVAMMCQGYDSARTYQNTMTSIGKEWGIAPLYQYAEYNSDGSVKEVNGTPVKGLRAAHDMSSCLAIPKNAKRKEKAAQFIKYFTSKTVQAKMLEGYNSIPVNMSQRQAYASSDNFVPNKNVVSEILTYSTPGDWSYVEDGKWINLWSTTLNTDVRDGNMTLETFFEEVTAKTNNSLANYKSQKYTGR